ncbi:hypothetical protein CC79DRAFT_1309654 [Sarocladium strictum]
MRLDQALRVLCFALTATAIVNPIITGWNPDASILRVEDDYYLATSSFEFFPGTPIYHSKDLASWSLYSHALTTPGHVQLYGVPGSSGGVWAPTLSYHEGIFYLASMTRWVYDPVQKLWPRVMFYTSKDLKTWSSPVWCEPWGIDPALFHDPVSGNSYLSLMAPNNNDDRLWGIYQCQVDLVTGRCIGPYMGLWNGTMEHTAGARPEGPKMTYKDGYYYLVIAEGGTDELHRASVARSRSPEGPFEPAPHNPILHNGQWGVKNLTVQSTGHATLVDTPDGEWYAVFLARRNVNGSSPLGREAFLTTVKWNDEGWPVLNDGKPITLSQSYGSTPDQDRVPETFVDTFKGPNLHKEWYQLRTPYTENYKRGNKSSSCGGGGVTLVPNVFGLDDRDTPAALLRKQKSLNMTFSATLKGTHKPLNIRQSVGISAYQSELVHFDIGVTGCKDNGVCLYTSLLMNGTTVVNERALNHTSIPSGLSLHIRAQPLEYSLGYSLGDDSVEWLQPFSSSWLAFAPPGYFVFSGASFALFASGGGEPWGFESPDVGFTRVEEVYFEENIPDYDILK